MGWVGWGQFELNLARRAYGAYCVPNIASKNNYWKVAAELVSDKEAYGAQKQALNI